MKNKKYNKLKEIIKDSGSMIIAFSGGVDSSFLLGTAVKVLGKNVIAVTVNSPLHLKNELNDARIIAKDLNCRHIIIDSNPLKMADFKYNPADRCYICKKEILSKLVSIKQKYIFNIVADGTNFDDLNKYRPGLQALKEFNIESPLASAGLTKKEIREYSKLSGLPNWNKPSQACLASRLPYGEKITKLKLKRIEKAENYLGSLGFKQKRVRYHYPTARIEVAKEEIPMLIQDKLRVKIIKEFKKIGFLTVSLDLEGYRSGGFDKTTK